ncbi:MAG: tetratricopeptide repeat protein [Rivularia sp. (in: cyanobacteria)]
MNLNCYKCKEENYRHLNKSQMIVLLVSQYFMDSDEGRNIGEPAMELYNAGKALVIPVKLRQIDNWEATPFGNLKSLPSNGEPVDNRRFSLNQNEAFVDIAKGIREEAEKLEQEQGQKKYNFVLINNFTSNQFFKKINSSLNISTRSVYIFTGILVVGFLGFHNFSQNNPAEIFLNLAEEKSEKSHSQKNKAKSLFNQGEQKIEKGNYIGAVKNYNQAIQIAPNYIDAYKARGDAHYFLKDIQSAIEDYTQVIRLDPELADAYMIRAIARCKLRDKQGALQDSRQAATLYAKQGATVRHQKFVKRLQKCI